MVYRFLNSYLRHTPSSSGMLFWADLKLPSFSISGGSSHIQPKCSEYRLRGKDEPAKGADPGIARMTRLVGHFLYNLLQSQYLELCLPAKCRKTPRPTRGFFMANDGDRLRSIIVERLRGHVLRKPLQLRDLELCFPVKYRKIFQPTPRVLRPGAERLPTSRAKLRAMKPED
jgi:hypothetical protein